MKTINNNIKEVRVSFPNAKLLKEKGFDVECLQGYSKDKTQVDLDTSSDCIIGGKCKSFKNSTIPENSWKTPLYTIPTQQVAIDWIFANFDVHINVWTDTNLNLPEYLSSAKWFYVINCDLIDSYDSELLIKFIFETPEEAKEAAINYVLTKLT